MSLLRTFALAVVLSAASLPALAAGGGGDGPGTVPNCGRGLVYDPGAKQCVKAKALNVDDATRIMLARAETLFDDHEDAIEVLDPIAAAKDPQVLNLLGYAHRKLDRLDTAFAYYGRAIEIDPRFALARSYRGEGYVTIGRLDLARAELAVIADLTGVGSPEFKLLDDVVALAERR